MTGGLVGLLRGLPDWPHGSAWSPVASTAIFRCWLAGLRHICASDLRMTREPAHKENQ